MAGRLSRLPGGALPSASNIGTVNLLGNGLRSLAGGARRGNGLLAGVGAALLAYEWIRRTTRPKRHLLFARTLRPGEALRIRLLDTEDEVEIGG